MLNKKLFAVRLVVLLLVLVPVACERDDDDDERARAASPTAPAPVEQPAPIQPPGRTLTYNFDDMRAGELPATFSSVRTGSGAAGRWEIRADDTAPSKPNVLAQTSTDTTDYRFPMAVSNEGAFKDFELSVKFKPVSGTVDQAGGLVFRYKDANNYYVARANAMEDNYRLYHVVSGRRVQFAGTDLKVAPNRWHELKVVCVGNQITCFYDGQQAIQATDETFRDAGKIGVWTKADSVTYFDDLSVTAR